MKGTLKLEISEALHSGEECTAIVAKCELMNVSSVDKIVIVHKVLDMLKFSEREMMALSLACAANCWPNRSVGERVIRDKVVRSDEHEG